MPVVLLTGGDGVELGLQSGGDLAARPAAYGHPVDAPDRSHLGSGATEEDLIGDVEHLARNRALDERNPQILRQVDDRRAGDAGEDRGGQRWGVEDPLLDEEEVLAAPLADEAVGVQGDALRVAV